MMIQIRVPGSCGELIQGSIDGQPFLVTCPIDLYATVAVSKGKGTEGLGKKAQLALKKVQDRFQLADYPYHIALSSELLPSKGMASSSADIAAVCQAAALSLGKQLRPADIAQIAAAIEPTDGVFYPGIVRMDHLSGRCLEEFGTPPLIRIAVFDTGGTVDTLSFNQRTDLLSLYKKNESQIKQALALLRSGIQSGDIRAIGQAATISALANQIILSKHRLEDLIAIVSAYGSIGINVAHSGTVIGILFAPEQQEVLQAMLLRLSREFPQLHFIKTVQLISGGCQVIQ